MKKYFTFLSILFIISSSYGQSEQYINAMKSAIEKISYDNSIDDITEAINQLERIAMIEKDEWLPPYYSALGYILLASKDMEKEGTKIGDYIDAAKKYMKKAKNIAPENSEVHTLQGYLYIAHIWKNPMINGAIYSPKAYAEFDKAIEIDPTNPRPDYLRGTNLFYTPAMFGGGPKSAKSHFDRAKEKFETFEPTSEIMPNWGEDGNNYFLEKCVE